MNDRSEARARPSAGGDSAERFTSIRATLFFVKRTNITLSLDSELVREAKVLAAQRGSSVSRLMSESLEELVRGEKAYDAARRRASRRLREASDLGWKRPASRDELHRRDG